jgi:hypothetical protein
MSGPTEEGPGRELSWNAQHPLSLSLLKQEPRTDSVQYIMLHSPAVMPDQP